MMPSESRPLREALHEAIEKLIVAMGNEDTKEAEVVLTQMAALIDQIPLVFRAREGDGR
jgi:hypothetical protein